MEALDIVRATMTEFADVEDDTVSTYIELIKPLVSKVKFKDMYEYALALVACHKMKLAGLGDTSDTLSSILTAGGASGLSSLSEGGVSVSFDNGWWSLVSSGKADESEYSRTIYGLQFLALRRQLVMNIVIDGSGFRSRSTSSEDGYVC